MILGTINLYHEAIIRLPVQPIDGCGQEIEVILDTGFNGSLTLPPAMIASLGLPWRTRGLVMLADGSEDYCDIYTATVVWDGEPKRILVEAADTAPLIGMALLYGHTLSMQIIEGGDVRIESLRLAPTSRNI